MSIWPFGKEHRKHLAISQEERARNDRAKERLSQIPRDYPISQLGKSISTLMIGNAVALVSLLQFVTIHMNLSARFLLKDLYFFAGGLIGAVVAQWALIWLDYTTRENTQFVREAGGTLTKGMQKTGPRGMRVTVLCGLVSLFLFILGMMQIIDTTSLLTTGQQP